VWSNPEAETSFQDAAAYDESIEVPEVKDRGLLNLPCPVSDFEILQIHLTTKQAQFKLNMDVGGKNTFLANTQGGNSAGVHVLLMSTHDPDVMNMNVQTASYTENAQPSVPDQIAEVNKDATSIMLYNEDAGGGGFKPGTTIRAWGVYKASGSAVLQIKDPDTGEWKTIKAIQGQHGRDGSDYILTETDKQEIAEQAAGLVDVPKYELPVADPNILGGVKPAAKTDAMTSPVGVDAQGGLWSAGGSKEWELVQGFDITEAVSAISVELPEDNTYHEIYVQCNGLLAQKIDGSSSNSGVTVWLNKQAVFIQANFFTLGVYNNSRLSISKMANDCVCRWMRCDAIGLGVKSEHCNYISAVDTITEIIIGFRANETEFALGGIKVWAR
jgi:hypothetical protein